MKFCPRCGNKLPANAIFCSNCGYQFPQGKYTYKNHPTIEAKPTKYTTSSAHYSVVKNITSNSKQTITLIIAGTIILLMLILAGWKHYSEYHLPHSIANQTIRIKEFNSGSDDTYHMHSKSFTINDDYDTRESYNVEHVTKSDGGKHIVVRVTVNNNNSPYTKFTFDYNDDQIEVKPSGSNE